MSSLKETVEWVRTIDVDQVEPRWRVKAQCYVDMVIEKSSTIIVLTEKIARYMDDVEEYVGQLAKVKLVQPPKEEVPPVIAPEPEEVMERVTKVKKDSPIIPKEEKVEQVQKRTKVPTKS